MTREEKVVKAKELRADGAGYREIGNELGASGATAYRWLNPDYAERSRAVSRAWKARNKGRRRTYEKQYRCVECPQCGGDMNRETERRGGVCEACHADRVDLRARQIEKWWGRGLTLKQIAAELGWNDDHVRVEIDHLRAKGYELPYRYRPGKRNATKYPEQVAT